MAGKRDTPSQKKKRDEASGAAGDAEQVPSTEVEVLTSSAGARRVYGRRRAADEHHGAMVASAARIDLHDRKAIENTRRRRQAWQTEAWDYYDEVGESGFTVDFGGNLMSKVRLFAAWRPNPKDAPVPVDDEESGVDPTTAKICVEALERLRSSEGGQSALVREMTLNFDVAGECYLHGHEDPLTAEEDWQIRSVDELVVTGDSFALRTAIGTNVTEPLPKDDLVVRLWQRHPRFSQLATCAMRRCLGEAEALLLLSREIRATSKSRLSAGLLLIPSEISFGPTDPTRTSQDGEGPDDPFEESLTEALTTPIQQEGSAAAVVPLIIRAPADLLVNIRHIDLQKSLDPTLDARIEGRILRIARALNFPVETTTGLQATTFANAATVKRSEWDAHGEPRAVLMCDALTAGYFQPAIEEAGIPAEQVRDFFIWFDPSDAISAPDPVDHVEQAHKDGIISDETRRRVQGYSEADAPGDDELLRRLLWNAPRMDPFILAQILKLTGLVPDLKVPAPQGGVLADDGTVTGLSPSVPAGAPVASALARALARPALAAASGRPRKAVALGQRLTEIDRDLRLRVHAAAEAAMQRALERAGNRVKSKAGYNRRTGDYSTVRRIADGVAPCRVAAAVGPTLVAAIGLSDDQLLSDSFSGLAADFGTWVDMAQQQAIAAVEQAVGPLDQAIKEALATNQATALEAAQAQLGRNMIDLAAARLYSPTGGLVQGEGDPSALVPMSLVRGALGTAGGDNPQGGVSPGEATAPLTSDLGGGPVAGVAAGPDMMEAVQGAGGGVDGYTWDYGGAVRTPFPPHMDLDGVEFVAFDDPVLENQEGFPDLPYYMPGDHEGCVCDVVPTIVFAGQEGAAEVPAGQAEEAAPTGGQLELAGPLIDAATAAEPAVTGDLTGLAGELGGEMQGLEFNVKTADSLARKIGTDALDRGITEEQAAAQIADVLRYTMTFEPGDYAARVQAAADRLQALGYRFAKVKNTWDPAAPYRGLNTQIVSPSGQVFELQFHTPESFDLKQENHAAYEAARILPDGDPQRAQLVAEMASRSAALELPPGALDLPNFAATG